MRNFKIKVTPEESEVVQKLLLLAGYKWSNGSTEVLYTNSPYLFFDNSDIPKIVPDLTYSKNECTFINNQNPEITFDEFINEIEIELNKSNHNDFLLDMF